MSDEKSVHVNLLDMCFSAWSSSTNATAMTLASLLFQKLCWFLRGGQALHLDMISFGSVFKSAPEESISFWKKITQKVKLVVHFFEKIRESKTKRYFFKHLCTHVYFDTRARARERSPPGVPSTCCEAQKGLFLAGLHFWAAPLFTHSYFCSNLLLNLLCYFNNKIKKKRYDID